MKKITAKELEQLHGGCLVGCKSAKGPAVEKGGLSQDPFDCMIYNKGGKMMSRKGNAYGIFGKGDGGFLYDAD